MKVQRVIILMPRDNSFYKNIARSLSNGFEAEGIKVLSHCGPLNEEAYVAMMRESSPDIVFEMNRVRSEVPWLDKKIKHISWVVDLECRDETQLTGSDILYVFDPDWLSYGTGIHKDWLPPGGTIGAPPTEKDATLDVVFLGHIPKPWSPSELGRDLSQSEDRPYKFSDLLEEYYEEFASRLRENKILEVNSPKKARDLALSILHNATGSSALDEEMEYDLLQRHKRMLGRLELMNLISQKKPDNIIIYGTENWRRWERFKPFYKGYLQAVSEMQHAMASASLCLHEGVGMHFRAMDCLGAGGNLLFYTGRLESQGRVKHRVVWGLHTWFSSGNDYLEVRSESELEEVFARARSDRKFLSEMGQRAQHKVRVMHTWRHRAQKILRDIHKYL